MQTQGITAARVMPKTIMQTQKPVQPVRQPVFTTQNRGFGARTEEKQKSSLYNSGALNLFRNCGRNLIIKNFTSSYGSHATGSSSRVDNFTNRFDRE